MYLLSEGPLVADEIYTLIPFFIFLVSDQSRTTPIQGETHQSVIPPLSVIHRKLQLTDGQADKQKGSINNRVRGETGKMPREIILLYCQYSRLKWRGGGIHSEHNSQP